MKNLLLALAVLVMASLAHSKSFGIIDIIEPISSFESYLVMASDGKVYSIDQSNKDLIDLTHQAQMKKALVEVDLGDYAQIEDNLEMISEIKSLSFLTPGSQQLTSPTHSSRKNLTESKTSLINTYISDFSDYSNLKQLFDQDMRKDTSGGSECYNRAHVWSYEMNKLTHNGRNIQMGKIWLFFTKKYIREYRYKWWFHVSPYLTLDKEVIVMDRKFIRQPVSEKVWTDVFIHSRENCKEVYVYSDYSQNQYARHCYVVKSSLYYWQPFQIEYLESRDWKPRDKWVQGEIDRAYSDALNSWDDDDDEDDW